MNVLFVCLGNICRSPIAEGILKKLHKEKKLKGLIESAGFESFHINEPPDDRAISVAREHQIDISGHKARLFTANDFDRFDHIYVMDTQNMQDVRDASENDEHMGKVDYLLNVLEPGRNLTVADPFNSGVEDFESVFDTLYRACEKICENAKKTR